MILGMKKLTFEPNRHYPTLRSLLYSLRLALRGYVEIKFTHESKYILGDSDQFDWNKLYGMGNIWRFGKWRKEQFWAWRYLPLTDNFEVVKYYREGGHIRWGEIVTVQTNEEKILHNVWFSLPIPLPTYFGGNRRTPNKIEILVK